MTNFENLDKFMFPGVGRYDIPQIEPVTAYPQGDFIPMNYANSEKDQRARLSIVSLTITSSPAIGTVQMTT